MTTQTTSKKWEIPGKVSIETYTGDRELETGKAIMVHPLGLCGLVNLFGFGGEKKMELALCKPLNSRNPTEHRVYAVSMDSCEAQYCMDCWGDENFLNPVPMIRVFGNYRDLVDYLVTIGVR